MFFVFEFYSTRLTTDGNNSTMELWHSINLSGMISEGMEGLCCWRIENKKSSLDLFLIGHV